ncbi:MAG: dephospho-CoA kinase [Amaricoccus sp.]
MTRPYFLGLTGSIGMGKSTTAALFREAGIPVWDADAAVHALYAAGGLGAPALADLVPAALAGGAVDREALKQAILADPDLLPRIEARIHPLVQADRAAFVAAHSDAALVVCDIPLLYETGAETALDGVLVVTAPAALQRIRVLARPGMTEAAFAAILARQLPDAEKRARADFLLDSSEGLDRARARVRALIAQLNEPRHA